jgi:hypothetical protein
MLLEFLMFPP